MCESGIINQETAGKGQYNSQSQHESKTSKDLKRTLAELEAKCEACTEKNCGIYCETMRRIECCRDLLADKRRYGNR